MIRLLSALALMLTLAAPAAALERFSFPSIDGGTIDSADWSGRPVLVVNTASRCAFTDQYAALQDLYDRYRDSGLVVLAVPSNDFRQELGSEAEVKEFCEMTFGLDLPMTTITSVRGDEAHPFYRWLAETEGFAPSWNFNKVLIDGTGRVAGTWGSTQRPLSSEITSRIEALLPKS
ncbi:Hydroperoxy fatty acid reductase gpx1 [Roseivivax jejudonensis]|uniref:Glutathione peroxidase n=1 Tax=Roseivivax jejudonensis TaxID=1529041 RepID=A0A1X6ZAA5_9RHOB|nr:glutathione peroxidase [Roseivivax jejudonensis]SLN43511.1 Hydroperoxy fatty acid reductase gpx1 [Roseivivax jejudonensis]